MSESYRWVDDEGNVNYSQSPPADDRKVDMIKPPVPPPEGEAAAASDNYKEQAKAYDQRVKQRKDAKLSAATKKEVAALVKKKCENAQSTITSLESRPPNTLFQLSTGEYKRFTVEERDEKLENSRAFIKQNCK